MISRRELALELEGAKPWRDGEEMLRYIEAEGWLRNPDQVPGRTITESEFDRRTSLCSELEAYWFKVGYFAAGGNIVADPEPTNVDRLKALYMEWKREGPTALDFAEWMDLRGVKAPDVRDG